MSIWKIWCDGSCGAPTNPGPCAWGSVIESPDGEQCEYSGFIDKPGTSSIAELAAATESLRRTPKGAEVLLFSDCRYVLDGIGTLLQGWKSKGWRKAAGAEVKNKELWQALYQQYKCRKVTLQWVRGHSGNPENERADRLARQALRKKVKDEKGTC